MIDHPWSPPKMWQGNTAYIIGGGPSLKSQDLSLIHKKRVIGVNNAFLLGDWVDVCWFGDMQWGRWHKKELLTKYHGLVASCNTNTHFVRNHPWIKFLRRGKAMGIDPQPAHVSWNHNSGCSAINLAYHFGATRIVLLGFDMSNGKKGETHWHGGHKQLPKDQKGNNTPYSRWVKTTAFIYRDARKLGIEILNASPITTITVFPKVKLEDVV